MLGDPVFGGAADAFIVILDRLVGKRVQFGEYFAQHQPEPKPEFEPEPDHEPVALDDAEPVTLGEPEPHGEPGSHRRARYRRRWHGRIPARFAPGHRDRGGANRGREPRLPQKDPEEPLTPQPAASGLDHRPAGTARRSSIISFGTVTSSNHRPPNGRRTGMIWSVE